MKYKTTRKALLDGSINLRSAGYCDLCHLLYNHDPIAYTCGKYGWNFDVYKVYGLTICTGYRGMPGERLRDTQMYDHRARDILDWDRPGTWEEKRDMVEELLKEFCVANGGKKECA